MTEQNHHDPAALDKLAEPFTVLPNDNPASDAKRQELIDKPAFGQIFSDNMAHISWTKGEGWNDRRIEPYAPLKLDPGASVLHYAQEIFEGLKAYKHADGSIWMFRPDANAERFQNSAKRLYLPELPVDDFIGSCAALVKRDAAWVPSRREYTLYLRPFMFASEPFLGVRAAQEVDYCVIASPSGPYFQGESRPVSIWVEDKWFRTGPGGTGFAKCGGNYAASLIGEYKGIENGCEQVCFVDAATKTYLEELGGMNMMIVHKDGHIETPSLTGNILPGVTRRSLIQLAQDKGHDVVETMIKLDDLLEDIKSGEVTEVFACGTAAIIAPIGRFKSEKFDVTVAGGEPGELTMDLRNTLLGIQLGAPGPEDIRFRGRCRFRVACHPVGLGMLCTGPRAPHGRTDTMGVMTERMTTWKWRWKAMRSSWPSSISPSSAAAWSGDCPPSARGMICSLSSSPHG